MYVESIFKVVNKKKKNQSALSRTLLHFCGTTFVETTVYSSFDKGCLAKA